MSPVDLTGAIWGKYGDGSAGPHPLLCHALDTAAVAERFLERVVPGSVTSSIARDLGIGEPALRAWITYLAAAHDIGKATPLFQWRVLPPVREHEVALNDLGLDDPGRGLGHKLATHGSLTGQALAQDLVGRGMPRPVAVVLSSVVGGHHGIPVGTQPGGTAQAGGPTWVDARADLLRRLAAVAGPGLDALPSKVTWPAALLIAGIVSVCDWLASDASVFRYAGAKGGADEAAYRALAARQAADVLGRVGWSGWQPDGLRITFRDSFGFDPRPVQAVVEQVSGPGIVVVEAPTGEGKTEAALHLADRWINALGYRGIYFALPSQATSNQLLGRMRGWLRRRYAGDRVELALLHPSRALNDEYAALRSKGRDPDPAELVPAHLYGNEGMPRGDGSGAVVATDWFSQRKRGLLAPFGVGTIDQALLAMLAVPHAFVRLLGLAGKVVVLDEVHAYDAYTFALIERLVAYLAASGSSVIVLSATLPNARRQALLEAWGRGCPTTDTGTAGIGTADGAAPVPGFPRLSWRSAVGAAVMALEVSSVARRSLEFVWVGDPLRDLDVLDHLLAHAAAGGRIGVVLNTVGRAQQVFRALEARARARGAATFVDLFHARYPAEDRLARERRAIARYGGSERLPSGSILVATQVIEQSLDLDFDLLATDLAPIDLLLQRAGRLQRHRRNDEYRPVGLVAPRLLVVRPEADLAGLPVHDRGSAAVYDGHLLDATFLAVDRVVRDGGVVRVPDDVSRLVEFVYGAAGQETAMEERWRERWRAGAERSAAAVEVALGRARARLLPDPAGDRLPDPGGFFRLYREDDEYEIQTRLGGDSISVALLEGTPGAVRVRNHAVGLDAGRRLPADLARAVLGRMVSLPAGNRDGGISPGARELLGLQVPQAFAATPGLARTRAVLLTEGGRLTTLGGDPMMWTGFDQDLGIVRLRP